MRGWGSNIKGSGSCIKGLALLIIRASAFMWSGPWTEGFV